MSEATITGCPCCGVALDSNDRLLLKFNEQQTVLLNAIDDLSGCLDNALETMPPKTLPYVQFHAAAEAVRVGRALLEKHGR